MRKVGHRRVKQQQVATPSQRPKDPFRGSSEKGEGLHGKPPRGEPARHSWLGRPGWQSGPRPATYLWLKPAPRPPHCLCASWSGTFSCQTAQGSRGRVRPTPLSPAPMRSPSSCPPFIPHAEKKPELPPSGAWRPRSPSRGVMTDAPCRFGRAVHRASVVMAQPRGGPSGGAVCSLLPRPPPPNACLGGLQAEGPRDPRRQGAMAEAPALHGGQCGLRPLPPPQRAHGHPPGTSLMRGGLPGLPPGGGLGVS